MSLVSPAGANLHPVNHSWLRAHQSRRTTQGHAADTAAHERTFRRQCLGRLIGQSVRPRFGLHIAFAQRGLAHGGTGRLVVWIAGHPDTRVQPFARHQVALQTVRMPIRSVPHSDNC